MCSLPAKMTIFLILAKKTSKIEITLFRSALFPVNTRVNLKYFVTDSLLVSWTDIGRCIFLSSRQNAPFLR